MPMRMIAMNLLLLTDAVEESLYRVNPSARAWAVFLATGANGLIQFPEQLFLLCRQVNGRFHGHFSKQITGAGVAHSNNTFAA